jgi:NAD(P)-dependent dehydrogenase (short-subunit alcohol dehydrogenase family)
MSLSFLSSWFNRHTCWEAPEPTASFQGKTVIITGGNTGLGLESAIWVVRLGAARVILACRSLEKGKVAAEHIRTKTSCAADVLDVWQVDMSSYASVIAFAEKVRGDLSRLDALFANAGVMANTFHLSEGNNEESLNINVISTALLIFLLHPKLRETAERHGCHTNVTITGSELWELAKFKESKATAPGQLFATMNDEKKSDMGDRYNVTKLLVVFVVRQIAELAPYESSHVVANTVSPGYVLLQL